MKEKLKSRKLAVGGLLTAIIALLTAYVKIPLPIGFAHIGDGAVIFSGIMLGFYGAIPAALGSALGDILAGYSYYAVFSAVIKGVMALIAAKWIMFHEQASFRNMMIVVAAFAFMTIAYFLTNTFLYSFPQAVASIFGDGMQAAVGAVISSVILKLEPRLARLVMR